jgi:hypothetical protein
MNDMASTSRISKLGNNFVWAFVLIASICLLISPVYSGENETFESKFNKPIELPINPLGTNKLNFSKPDEGYYSCRWFRMQNKPLRMASGDNLSNSNYLGFNFYKDGTLKLRKRDKTFEEGIFHWRHNPVSGRLAFTDGPLAEIFAWPTHMSMWANTEWISDLVIEKESKFFGIRTSIFCQNRDRLIPISQ